MPSRELSRMPLGQIIHRFVASQDEPPRFRMRWFGGILCLLQILWNSVVSLLLQRV